MNHIIRNPIRRSTPQSSRILVVARCNGWTGIARLPKALQHAGFKVAVLCYPEAFLAKTRYVDTYYLLKNNEHSDEEFGQLMARAIVDWKPQLVVPGDEPTIHLLHWLTQDREGIASMPDKVLKVLQRSLGSPEHFVSTNNKNTTCRVASELGLRVPEQVHVKNPNEALRFYARRSDRAVVLKAPCGWAGLGVRVCANEAQIRSAFKRLSNLEGVGPINDHPPVPESAKTKQNAAWLDSHFLSAQQFISGTAAIYSAVALKGELLAGYSALKELVHLPPTGPGAVVRFIDHPEMTATASTLINHFRYTGFIEFCFMVEKNTGHAYLLECNPRPAPIASLGSQIGVDLCEALFRKLNRRRARASNSFKAGTVIAIFPQEWRRDPESAWLRNACHDVPWDDPELLKSIITS